MTKPDISEKLVKKVFLAIGSNLGNRKKNIDLAKFKLTSKFTKIISCSSYYETPSWPNPRYPKFINIVILIKTNLTPMKLLDLCNIIEVEIGRKRVFKNDPRTCDIDIIDYDKKIINITGEKKLEIPHPSMHNRNFVLLPLFEISKRWIHPQTKESIEKLIKKLNINELSSIKQI